jgi:hypothetical protein
VQFAEGEGKKRNPVSVGGLGRKSEVLVCIRRKHTYHGFDPTEHIYVSIHSHSYMFSVLPS